MFNRYLDSFKMDKINIRKQDIESEIIKLKSRKSLLEDELKLTELKIEGFKIRLMELNH